MAITRQISLGTPAAASANNIAQSQSPGAGAIVLNGSAVSGGVATLDVARRVLITPGGADAGITYTVVGTGRGGQALTETVQGVNNPSTVTTTQDFKTVTAVTHSGSVAGTVTVGTVSASTAMSSEWVAVDTTRDPINIGIAVFITGTINYTVEYTYDDVTAPFSGTFPTVFNIATGSLTSKAANGDSQANPFNFPVWAVRVTVNSYTAGATLKMIVQQAGGP